jgi:hypothetical protein
MTYWDILLASSKNIVSDLILLRKVKKYKALASITSIIYNLHFKVSADFSYILSPTGASIHDFHGPGFLPPCSSFSVSYSSLISITHEAALRRLLVALAQDHQGVCPLPFNTTLPQCQRGAEFTGGSTNADIFSFVSCIETIKTLIKTFFPRN